MALFAGAGGGILGGKLLGWRTVCAVEWEAYPASVLCARQNDGFLPPFPIWDDVQTFDGKPWAGIVDVVSGGFPCQDISAAGGGLALMENEAGCGEKWRGSFVKYDPDLSLWKTHQCSLLGDLEEFLETWPQWGLMRDGECWEQRTLEQTIRGTGFGLSEKLPTPTATDYKNQPTSSSWKAKGAVNFKLSNPEIRAKWGTPKAQDSRHALWDRGKSNLGEQVSGLHNGGKLNPNWVEWLMGWPIGWTDLKPLETDKFHCAPQQHGES